MSDVDMGVVVLAAGRAQRFRDYAESRGIAYVPKPLVRAHIKTILEHTVESLDGLVAYKGRNRPYSVPPSRVVFAILKEDDDSHGLSAFIRGLYGDVKIVRFGRVTSGPLETAIVAVKMSRVVGPNSGLVVSVCDNAYNPRGLAYATRKLCGADSGLMCPFPAGEPDTKWSHVLVDKHGMVTATAEKDYVMALSGGMPLMGTWVFGRAALFISAADDVMKNRGVYVKDATGEVRLSHVFQCLLSRGVPVHAHMVDTVVPLGTPEDVNIARAEVWPL